MENEDNLWNANLVTSIFPTQIKYMILKTPIQHAEQDSLIWIPSTSLEFSIKATHVLIRQNNRAEDHIQTIKEWNKIWKLKMYNRHKLPIWKMLGNVLPTLHRIQKFLKNKSL